MLPSSATEKMPVLFLGHGNPMNAVEDNVFTRKWAEVTKNIPTPKAILIISAHWETRGGTRVFSGEKPKMIYDMYGFPKHLYEVNYPAPGSPELAAEMVSKINFANVEATEKWGLDHGAWSLLVKMYPQANIPCFQMSLNYTRDLQWHYDLAAELSYLREKGVLILCSGNIVHNLRVGNFDKPAPDWALSFDDYVARKIVGGDHKSLINYQSFGDAALMSVNSAEHYIPMLYALALQESREEITFFNDNVSPALMDVGMRCFRIG